MASFAYSAINAQGVELSGEINATDLPTAREQLRVKGLLAQSIKELDTGGGVGQTSISFGKKVKPKSLQIFSRQFATMIEAGLNVVSALVILEEQTDDQGLAVVVSELRRDVEGGLLLSEAMSRHPGVFSRLYVAMVEAGEWTQELGPLQAARADADRRHRAQDHDGALLADTVDPRRRGRRHHQGARDHRSDGRQLGHRGRARGCAREGARGRADRAA